MIVCLGDSITAGQLVAEEKAWPALVRADSGEDLRVAAQPGDTTRLALERFPRDVQALAPEAVIIQFGHNDANRWQTDGGVPRVSRAGFEANLEEMLARCRVFGITPFFCTLTPCSRSPIHAQDVADYNTGLEAVAARWSVRLVDVRTAFEPLDDLLLDGIHLSEAGHRIFASIATWALADWRRS